MKKQAAAKSQESSLTLPITVLVIVVLGLGAYILSNTYSAQIARLLAPAPSPKESANQVTPKSTPSISPTPYPITKGPFEYKLSWGKGTTVPYMLSMKLDPHDPAVGTKQTVTLHFTHTAPIASITMILATDTQKNSFPMTLASGTDMDGFWTGSWTIPESHEYTYTLTPMVRAEGKEIPYKTVIRELP